MNKEIVVFGHNDLDQLGCMLNIECAFPGVNKTWFHTNYRDIHDVVDDTIRYIQKHQPELLMITDVSFAQERDLLVKLIDVECKVIYLDHHVYPKNFFDGLEMAYIHDVTKSATQITHDYLNVNHDKLNIITKIINAYDIWLTNDPFFDAGVAFNQYFWEKGMEFVFEHMKTSFIFPDSYKSTCERLLDGADEFLLIAEKRNLIHRTSIVSIGFIDDYFNQFLIQEFKSGQQVTIIANSYGILRVRFNQDIDTLTKDIKNKMKFEIIGDSNIGHLNAFAFKVDKVNFKNIMQEIKRITDIIAVNIK